MGRLSAPSSCLPLWPKQGARRCIASRAKQALDTHPIASRGSVTWSHRMRWITGKATLTAGRECVSGMVARGNFPLPGGLGSHLYWGPNGLPRAGKNKTPQPNGLAVGCQRGTLGSLADPGRVAIWQSWQGSLRSP